MKGTIEVEKAANGYTVCVREEKENGTLYPDYEKTEFVAASSGEVLDLVSKWIGGSKASDMVKKEV